MELLELILKRRSVRRYMPDEIEQGELDYMMECVRLAPSAANLQPWEFIVVKSEEKRILLQKCYPAKWFTSAPIYIVAIGKRNQSWKRDYDSKDHCDIDVAIALEHLALAATEKGIGTCWVCDFDAELCRELLQLPERNVPTAIMTIGYPAQELENVTNRKVVQEIVSTI